MCHQLLTSITKHLESALRLQQMQFQKEGEFSVTEMTPGCLFIDRFKEVGRTRRKSIAARRTHHVPIPWRVHKQL